MRSATNSAAPRMSARCSVERADAGDAQELEVVGQALVGRPVEERRRSGDEVRVGQGAFSGRLGRRVSSRRAQVLRAVNEGAVPVRRRPLRYAVAELRPAAAPAWVPRPGRCVGGSAFAAADRPAGRRDVRVLPWVREVGEHRLERVLLDGLLGDEALGELDRGGPCSVVSTSIARA